MGIFFNPQHTHSGKLDMKLPPPPQATGGRVLGFTCGRRVGCRQEVDSVHGVTMVRAGGGTPTEPLTWVKALEPGVGHGGDGQDYLAL